MLQAIIKHSIIAIITIAISVPIIYYTINASLEASINNYRNSQSILKLYIEKKARLKQLQNSINCMLIVLHHFFLLNILLASCLIYNPQLKHIQMLSLLQLQEQILKKLY